MVISHSQNGSGLFYYTKGLTFVAQNKASIFNSAPPSKSVPDLTEFEVVYTLCAQLGKSSSGAFPKSVGPCQGQAMGNQVG